MCEQILFKKRELGPHNDFVICNNMGDTSSNSFYFLFFLLGMECCFEVCQ